MKTKIVLPLLIIILIGLLGIKALFHSGFYTSHDGRHQIIRLMHFHKGMVDGQFPVRWAGTAMSGYGYPLFIFTYRLPFWIAESWYLLSKNLGDAIKFAFIVTYIASGLTMYCFLDKIWSSKLAGILGAVLYLWAPYRFLDIYVRASLGEATTFVFIPLIFLGIYSLAKEKKKQVFWIIFTAFCLAGLVLAHAMVLGLWLIPIGLWYLFNFYQNQNKKGFFSASFLAVALSLFLTAYYWVPAMTERKYVKFSGILGDYYKAHFVSLKQLLYSPWGYGFSMPGVQDDMMSFQVGIAQWLVVCASLFYWIVFILRRAARAGSPAAGPRRGPLWVFLLFWQAIFIISIYLMLPHSEWFYKLGKKFIIVDIPWRFLGISVFSAGVLFAGLIAIPKNNLAKWGLAFFVLFLAFYGNRNHLRVNKYLYLPDSEYWQSTETSNEYQDYAPLWFTDSKVDQRDPQLVNLEGTSNNKLQERKSNFFRFYSEVSSKKAKIATKVAYYPGWQIFVDGKKQKISQEDGKIKIDLDKGNHLVTLIFRETKLRYFCNWLSLGTLIGLIYFLHLRGGIS